jgi:prevent-host-death family protein
MRIAPVAEVKAKFSEYLKKAEKSPIIVTKNGRPVAAIVSAPQDEAEMERFILANTPRFQALLNHMDSRIRKTGGIDHDVFWKSVQKKRVSRKAS